MFTKSTRLNAALSIALVFAFGACGNTGGCAGCNVQPLPTGGLPADQTVEGGGQTQKTLSAHEPCKTPGVQYDGCPADACLEERRRSNGTTPREIAGPVGPLAAQP